MIETLTIEVTDTYVHFQEISSIPKFSFIFSEDHFIFYLFFIFYILILQISKNFLPDHILLQNKSKN